VAGVVGWGSIHIWGFEGGGETERYSAVARGVALQLTNILRDLREDASQRAASISRAKTSAHGT
jgi:phytoene synthase